MSLPAKQIISEYIIDESAELILNRAIYGGGGRVIIRELLTAHQYEYRESTVEVLAGTDQGRKVKRVRLW